MALYIGDSMRKYKVDANQFINCNSKKSAYILGFLWSDGYLNNISQHYAIRLEIVKDDFLDIKNLFSNWSIQYRHRKNRQPQVRVSIGQKPFYDFLKINDYEIKSLASACKILQSIPDKLKPYWWRGFFDGDGCFYYNKKNNCRQMSICGSYDQDWSFVKNLFLCLDIPFKIIKRSAKNGNKHSVIRITNKKYIEKFGYYIYESKYDKLGLTRKYKKFIDIISQ